MRVPLRSSTLWDHEQLLSPIPVADQPKEHKVGGQWQCVERNLLH